MKGFTLTGQHIRLLSQMHTSWDDCEFGAPCIDPKRPYGNSDVISHIIKILDIPTEICPHCNEVINERDTDRLEELHKETETALEIVLRTKSFVPGYYLADDYSSNWRLKR